MTTFTHSSSSLLKGLYKTLRVAALSVATAATLSACYVVPMHSSGAVQPMMQNAGGAVMPAAMTLQARLYPDNDAASSMGLIAGQIITQLDGRGTFAFQAGGESFSGEATRTPRSSSGTANAAGNKGGYMRCNYTMHHLSLGTGQCTLNGQAAFKMHIGS